MSYIYIVCCLLPTWTTKKLLYKEDENDKLTSFSRASSFFYTSCHIYSMRSSPIYLLHSYHAASHHSCAFLFDIINVSFTVLTAELFTSLLIILNSPREEFSNNFELFQFFITLCTAIFMLFCTILIESSSCCRHFLPSHLISI